MQLLGIGRNGHIGFNEPFSAADSRTRVATLDPLTRRDAASDFFSEENVPMQAITMGLGTIFEARKIVLIALGEHKAGIIRETAEGAANARVPACYLREHPDATLLLDHGGRRQADRRGHALAAGQGRMDRRADQAGRAVAERTVQARRCSSSTTTISASTICISCSRHHGPAQSVAHRVFRWMMDTIEYHPAGRVGHARPGDQGEQQLSRSERHARVAALRGI